jgi:hypothetical protein
MLDTRYSIRRTQKWKLIIIIRKGKKMKTNYGKILVLVMAIVITLPALSCWAVEKKRENVWAEDGPERRGKRFELTDEAIERIIDKVAETNPEEARELAKLRERNPDEFKEIMRERLAEEFRGRMMMGPGFRAPGMMGRGGGGRARAMMMRERQHAEYIEWLEENFPEESEKLAELRENRPELYLRKLGLSIKRYGRIAKASKENPELAEVLKEDLELKDRRDELLKQIREAADDNKKEKLIEDLEKAVNKRFDLIVKRKQMEYERLRKELKKLEKEVKKNEAEVEKWKDYEFKEENVKARLKELVARVEKFRWE